MKKKLIIALFLILLTFPLAGCEKEVTVTNYYDEGIKLAEDKSYTAAIKSFEKELEANPSSTQTYLEIANIYESKGLTNKAIETLDIGIENSSEDKNLYFKKAQILFEIDDYESAIESFDKAKKAGYDSDSLFIQKSNCYIKLEQYDEAKEILETISEDSNYYADASYYLSVLETEDYTKSLNYLASAANSTDEDIQINVDILKELLEEIIEKETNSNTNPNYLKLLHGYALIKVEEFEIAKSVIEPVARYYEEEGKPSYQANFFLGSIYYHLGNYENANTELNTSIVANPTDPNTLHLLGLNYSKLNDQTKSLETFEKAMMLDPDNENCLYDYIQILIKYKINSTAEKNYEELIKLETDKKPQYQLEFAQFLNDVNNNPTKASSITSYLINEWKEFETSSAETKAEIYDTYGWSLYLIERDDEAQDYLTKAIEENEFSGYAYYHLGKVMQKKEDFDKAKEYFAKAIDFSFDENLSEKANQEYQNLTQ